MIYLNKICTSITPSALTTLYQYFDKTTSKRKKAIKNFLDNEETLKKAVQHSPGLPFRK